MIFSEINGRAQVDLIDIIQSQVDWAEYRFIMFYQDHVTKLIQITALKTKRAEEVAKHNIMDIFCIFGGLVLQMCDSDI